MKDLSPITELERLSSPAPAPQALAWHGNELWVSSRDLRRIYRIAKGSWKVLEELEAPGIPWAAVSTGDMLWFTLGEGEEDDRYLHRFQPDRGFLAEGKIACPEFTGSYLGYDGSNLYLSQWYNHRILKLGPGGEILREISIGAEISGYVFVDGLIYVLCGTEQGEGDWRIGRLDPTEQTPRVEELAAVPFQCRSLTFDGTSFWTNHREANRTVCFRVPRVKE
jgi:hypothetical protein